MNIEVVSCPKLGDVYEWLYEVVEGPIDKAGLLLFAHLGYISEDSFEHCNPLPAKRFIYSILPEGKYLNALDRMYLESICSAVSLCSIDAECGPPIPIFAIDMIDVGSMRSEEAYGIHFILSKYCDDNNIVLFRHCQNVMLSFQYFNDTGGMRIVQSEWISPLSDDHGVLIDWDAASTPCENSALLFDAFAFNASREYEKNSMTLYEARYSLTIGVNDLWTPQYPLFYSLEEIQDSVQKLLEVDSIRYGDDYIPSKTESIEKDEMLDIDDIEWDMEHGIEDLDMQVDTASADDDVDESGAYNVLDIPPDVLSNPIKLLAWIEVTEASEKTRSNSVG